MDKLPKYVPAGRILELTARDDAERIAYTIPTRLFADYAVKRYASRKALEAFCKPGSRHHALVKVPTHPTMVTNPNIQERGAQ